MPLKQNLNALLKDFVSAIILTVLIWSIGYFFTKNKLSIK